MNARWPHVHVMCITITIEISISSSSRLITVGAVVAEHGAVAWAHTVRIAPRQLQWVGFAC
jgi:ribulose-5-phosphate 4-epimerase/fuculose-1-phosphate aldolase